MISHEGWKICGRVRIEEDPTVIHIRVGGEKAGVVVCEADGERDLSRRDQVRRSSLALPKFPRCRAQARRRRVPAPELSLTKAA